ncbi:MAG TPA: tetratricopeptide repeat protein, partial [Aggregicoccus sp.]|nr:tetratricopeptide repeat protein [Aggregicoccus sp.]
MRNGILAARTLAEAGRSWEARERLLALADQHPGNAEVLDALLSVTFEAQDWPGYLEAATRLAALFPEDAELAFARGEAALRNGYPATGVDYFEQSLARFPDLPEAADVRAALPRLHAVLPDYLATLGAEPGEGRARALQHERVQHLMSLDRMKEARDAARALHVSYPRFVAALNNLGYAAWQLGALEEAEQAHREALALRPDDVHALSNLTRTLFLGGREQEARALAERLKASTHAGTDRWLKVAEALTLLGDDAGVLEAFAHAEREAKPGVPEKDARLRTIAAVSALRLGDESRARTLLEEALQRFADTEEARANLAALELPAPVRPLLNAAPLEAWLSPPQLERVRARLGAAKKPEAQRRARAELLSELPGLRTVVPALLDRGNPEGVRLALELCEHSEEPALLEALGRFARGERGHIRDRVRAAHALVVAGAAREEELALWTGRGRQPFA